MFRAARALHMPWIYLAWARAAYVVYQGLTYSRGRLGAALDRIERAFSR